MTERQLQFRVGLVVVLAGVCAVVMILQFGEFGAFWRKPVTAETLLHAGSSSTFPSRLGGSSTRTATARRLVAVKPTSSVVTDWPTDRRCLT